MGKIEALYPRNQNIIDKLLNIWESSVKKTHLFLTDVDIQNIKSEVNKSLWNIKYLYGFYDENDFIQGFIGVEKEKIEMLFIDADTIGQGIGKLLLSYAIKNLNAKYVDVNEQNLQGLGFYTHLGFNIINRSKYDESGRPFPILHLTINQNSINSLYS